MDPEAPAADNSTIGSEQSEDKKKSVSISNNRRNTRNACDA